MLFFALTIAIFFVFVKKITKKNCLIIGKIGLILIKKEFFMRKEYMPHYIRIKSDIINKISSGELRKGDRLPAERELAERFGVSRITVVGALKALVEEGIVERSAIDKFLKVSRNILYVYCFILGVIWSILVNFPIFPREWASEPWVILRFEEAAS
jgi:DNA-binding transcriptional ArsR family regulator